MKTIAIVGTRHAVIPHQVLDALAQLFDLRFIESERLDRDRCSGAISFGITPEQIGEFTACGLPCLIFVRGRGLPMTANNADVEFAETAHAPAPFRGRRLSDKAITQAVNLDPGPDDHMIAKKAERALWVRRHCGKTELDLVAFDPPTLTANDRLFELIRQHDSIRLLPMLDFARRLSDWKLPELRAAFMFDDPNLHWPSYGYVRYRDLVQDACRHNYHACFATIPMDSWYVHRPTARLFKENAARISLLVHGNDHTFFELSRTNTSEAQEALVAKALWRIAHLEQRAGLDIPRVMAPPHGGCNEGTASALLRGGFEAACISTSSLTKRNPETVWPATVGLNPAELFGGGLPVIPRYNIHWDATYPLFAAFLGQSIIAAGHHDDASRGFEYLRKSAALINSFGAVQWMDMQSMARTNFSTWHDGDVLRVRLYARRIRLAIPEGCRHVSIERPLLNNAEQQPVKVIKPGALCSIVAQPDKDPIPVAEGSTVEIAAIATNPIDYRRFQTPVSPVWAIARRQLCEVRDRLAPAVDALLGPRPPRQRQRSFVVRQSPVAKSKLGDGAKSGVVPNV